MADPFFHELPAGVSCRKLAVFKDGRGILAYALSQHWTSNDELGCSWNDPALGLSWPVTAPLLSERDKTAGSYRKMVEAFRGRQATAQHAAAR